MYFNFVRCEKKNINKKTIIDIYKFSIRKNIFVDEISLVHMLPLNFYIFMSRDHITQGHIAGLCRESCPNNLLHV